MTGSLASLVALCLRCCIMLVKSEARRRRKEHPWSACPHEKCDCECCQWVRGLEGEGDEKLGGGWR